MPGMTVAVVGDRGLAAQLGKKGTSSDVTLYNHVADRHALTVVEPTNFPEKLPPLLIALGMAERALLVIEALSKAVAETIAVADLLDLPTDLVLGPNVGEEEVERAVKGTRFAGAPKRTLDPLALRTEVESWRAPARGDPVRVPLDHAFAVKGVGAVALGVVRAGSLKAHETLRLWPTPRSVEVRSIQVHDVDVPQASTGERVGVALKGIDAEELARGQVLAPATTLSAGSELVGRTIRRCRYFRGDWGEGSQMHLAVGLQVVPVGIGTVGPGSVRLTTDRPIVFAEGDGACLLDLSVPAGPRIVARVDLAAPITGS